MLRSWFLWAVLVVAAVAVGAFVAGGSDEEEPPVPDPAAPSSEEALGLAAEGLVPDAEVPPEEPGAQLLETRTGRARGSVSLVSQWVEAYAVEYGHYPVALGMELDALVQFSEGADMEWVLAPFEGERLDYVRSVAPGGEEESFLLRASVRGTDREVTARGSRPRGGDPRNPAPLGRDGR